MDALQPTRGEAADVTGGARDGKKVANASIEAGAKAIAALWGLWWECPCSSALGLECDCGDAMSAQRVATDDDPSHEDLRAVAKAVLLATPSSDFQAGAEAMRQDAITAIMEAADKQGLIECCGDYQRAGDEEIECCGQPFLTITDAHAINAIRALPLPKGSGR